MTLGEKLKEARKHSGLSQEQLSEKLCVSRSAVAKWETDKGIPDIDNLKALSELLEVSIDSLLNPDEGLNKSLIRESIDLSVYEGRSRKKKKDHCIREKFPNATINTLLAKINLTKNEKILDEFIGWSGLGIFGTVSLVYSIKNIDKEYYLAEQDNKQFLVVITDDYIESRELSPKQYSRKFEIDGIQFTKCAYTVK